MGTEHRYKRGERVELVTNKWIDKWFFESYHSKTPSKEEQVSIVSESGCVMVVSIDSIRPTQSTRKFKIGDEVIKINWGCLCNIYAVELDHYVISWMQTGERGYCRAEESEICHPSQQQPAPIDKVREILNKYLPTATIASAIHNELKPYIKS